MPDYPDIFGVDMAGKINEELGPLVFDITLTVVTVGTRVASTEGTQPTEATHTVKGFVGDYKDREIDGEIIQRGDRKVIILGGSLPSGVVPKQNDKTTIGGETRRIQNIQRDPAAATYKCQVR